MRRNSILLISSFLLLSLLLWGAPVRAETTDARTGPAPQNRCMEQVFHGVTLQVTVDGGITYYPVQPIGLYVLRSIYACPITSAVTLGSLQRIGFMADQLVMVVYASPDGSTYYVHRQWQVYAITAAQWQRIVAAVNVKVAH